MVFCILTRLQEYLHAAWARHDGIAAHGAVRSSGSDLTDGVSAVACKSARVRSIGACFQKGPASRPTNPLCPNSNNLAQILNEVESMLRKFAMYVVCLS